MKRLLITSVGLLWGLVLCGPAALAENKNWPPATSVTDLSDAKHWPDDPGYKSAWGLYSFIPAAAKSTIRKAELTMGSGISADRAWQMTTGDGRVVIAVLDSGIRWNESDLVNKYYLNRGELPQPDAACQTSAYDAKRPWDANGDSIFNVQDYTFNSGHALPASPCDPRVKNFSGGWDTNKNKMLDPQDLIQIFSDGKDSDSNGYVDDISGWDFFDNDNDPNDDTAYGHGTAEAKWSSAEGNNGRGDIGTCPSCRVMPVRVGDSFVVDGNDFGMGVIFAVDSGAAVVQEALGAMNNSGLAISAIDYAYNSNVVVIGAAGDENAYHYNFPAANEHSTYIHAIVYDSSSISSATTFLNYNNCTNYGPRLQLSTSGSACSSEATGKTAGVAGLIYSAALKAGLPFPGGAQQATDKLGARRLTAEEVIQVLTNTVDDINVPESKTDTTKYPSKAGWEQRFGYGRVNARQAVDVVLAKKLPPEVDILAPTWFRVFYSDKDKKVSIKVRLAFRVALFDSLDYVVEWAGGADPIDSAFKTLTAKTGLTASATIQYDWDISKLAIDNPDMPAPDYDANKRLVTLRVRATAHSKNLGQVSGQARKAFHITQDPDLLPGFPLNLISSGDASPKTADLNDDGKREIIVATSDGQVHAISGDGKALNGWPVKVNIIPALDPKNPGNNRLSHAFTSAKVSPDHYSNIIGSPAIGDLDNDKVPEVVAASFDGGIYVWGPDGKVRTGFPLSLPALDKDKVTDKDNRIDEGVIAAPALADLDGDKRLEIVVAAMDGKVYVWTQDGKSFPGFPVQLQDPKGNAKGIKERGRIISSPAIGDIDGDQVPDIVMGTNETLELFAPLYVIHGQGDKHPGGAYHQGWPRRLVSAEVLPVVGEGLTNAPALADINGDGLPEIAIGGIGGAATIYRNTGESKFPLCFTKEGVNPAPNKTDWVQYVTSCKGKTLTKSCDELEKAESKVQCVGGAMNNIHFGKSSDSTDFPTVVLIANSSFGDLDNDGLLDLVMPTGGFGAAKAFASGGKRSDFDIHISAWNSVTRQFKSAFPRRIHDWHFFMTPAIADISGDVYPEVIAGSAGYWLRAWDKTGKEPSGWPKLTGQWVVSSPSVGDLTGDKRLEVVVNTRSGWLYAWKTKGKVGGRVDWESFGHDNRNTRNLSTPLAQGIPSSQLPDAGVADSGATTNPSDEGCNCNLPGSSPGAQNSGQTFGLGMALALMLARRRRR